MSEPRRDGSVGPAGSDGGGVAVVLPGGGVRGAYEAGALAELLPAPRHAGELGSLAERVYCERYGGLRGLRDPDFGRLLRAGGSSRGELLSFLLFEPPVRAGGGLRPPGHRFDGRRRQASRDRPSVQRRSDDAARLSFREPRPALKHRLARRPRRRPRRV